MRQAAGVARRGRQTLRTRIRFVLFATLALTLGEVAGADAVVGRPAPDATFVTADGSRINLSAYRGTKAVVVLFTRGSDGSFSCYYCGGQTREYKAAYERLKEAGAEVLSSAPSPVTSSGRLCCR